MGGRCRAATNSDRTVTNSRRLRADSEGLAPAKDVAAEGAPGVAEVAGADAAKLSLSYKVAQLLLHQGAVALDEQLPPHPEDARFPSHFGCRDAVRRAHRGGKVRLVLDEGDVHRACCRVPEPLKRVAEELRVLHPSLSPGVLGGVGAAGHRVDAVVRVVRSEDNALVRWYNHSRGVPRRAVVGCSRDLGPGFAVVVGDVDAGCGVVPFVDEEAVFPWVVGGAVDVGECVDGVPETSGGIPLDRPNLAAVQADPAVTEFRPVRGSRAGPGVVDQYELGAVAQNPTGRSTRRSGC